MQHHRKLQRGAAKQVAATAAAAAHPGEVHAAPPVLAADGKPAYFNSLSGHWNIQNQRLVDAK
jgi:hypothetical protein